MEEIDNLDNQETTPAWKYETKQTVWWSDPSEGISSGEYMIIERVEYNEPGYHMYLLSNGRYNVEAYEKDLMIP